MACFTLRGPNGDRKVEENTSYTLQVGEAIVPGLIDWGCGPQLPGDPAYNMQQELAERGVQWGDAIAWVTKKIGMKQCAPCKARQEIFNRVSELGWVETIRQIKATV
jgi:hypothetical protein